MSVDPNTAIIAHRLAIASLANTGETVAFEAARGFASLRRIARRDSDDGMYDYPGVREIVASLGKVITALNDLMPMPTTLYKAGAPPVRMPNDAPVGDAEADPAIIAAFLAGVEYAVGAEGCGAAEGQASREYAAVRASQSGRTTNG